MYDQFYGLQGRPFQLTPDPAYYFESATHRKALSYLGYGLAQGEGFIVITGDIGAGKTTLVGHLMQTIDPARLTAVKIVSTQVEGDDMLRLAAQSFGLATDGQTKAATLRQIESFLYAQARAGRRTLLIVDEAQNLSVSAIEELRMLSNFQLGGQSLLQIFLLGQPEFRDLLKSSELEQLRQRVIATHHLEPMMAGEVEPYVLHRLSIAGWQGNPSFTPAAYDALYAATGGVPRRLNALVSRVLLLGAIEQLAVIDANVVGAVVEDMGLDADIAPEPAAPSVLDTIEDAEGSVANFALVEDEDRSAEINPEPEESAMEEPVIDAPFAAPEVDVQEASESVEAVNTADGFAAEQLRHDMMAEIEALRGEIASLRAMQAHAPFAPNPEVQIDPDALKSCFTLIEERLASLEFRAEEQDTALRRVLTLLIDWVEREEQNADMQAVA
ncbi:general secretion pathway protein [Sphingobium amiense]|uniref:General secretion pathway protein n=1 Tax=Sphingobium amiense TaxID=135719 RepID=A0A494WA14_9SPHN|nr:XrtA/PEP-CTERM system-associated ATPase [Sphingobium amiense]BBD97490.1 general secretion pathway protein [Sphingobium amiense]